MLSRLRERRSWRCVGRRREEPAARRRATNGTLRLGSSLGSASPRRSASPRSPLPHFIEDRVQRWLDLDAARDGSLPLALRQRGAVTDFGIRQNPADYASKTSFECERMSPRAASMRSACNALPRVLAAGLVMPLASPINFRRSGSKRVPRHVMPLSTEREHGILFARLVSPWR
jgi:hypothetical protein